MNAKKKSSKENFKNSITKNILLIIITGVVLLMSTLVFLHLYTRQNKSVKVPSVKGVQLEIAKRALQKSGLGFVVIDSIYNRDSIPGTIIEQVPAAFSSTKEGREVFLTIYSSSPPQLPIPNLIDYSLRQAEAQLKSMGFDQLTIEEVPSEYKGLVKSIKFRGRQIQPEERIPSGSPLTIVVGSGLKLESQENDSISVSPPNSNGNPTEPKQKSGTNSPIVDDTFF